MDAFGDYVWPRATSELILLPVTGLECVGDRLLAGEAWSVLVVLVGEELASPRVVAPDKGMPWRGGWAAGWGLARAGSGKGHKAGSEVAGNTGRREEGGARGTVAALHKLQPAWKGWTETYEDVGDAVVPCWGRDVVPAGERK